MVLNGTALGTNDPPIIEVDNDSDVELYLHVGKLTEMSVSPHIKKSFPVQTGAFSFNAAGANVLPDFGYIAFLNGNKYPWHFFIRSAHEQKDDVVAPETITEYNNLLADIKKKQEEAGIEKPQVDDARTVLDKQGDKAKAELSDVNIKRVALDYSDQKAVSDFNGLVDTANNDLQLYEGMKEPFNAKVNSYNSLIDALNAEQQQLGELEKKINAPH